MRPGHWILTVAVAFLLATQIGVAAEEPEVEGTTVVAESAVSFEQATEKALRKAVRQVIGVVVESETKTADFRLVRDAIFTRARGYVRRYKVLDKKEGLNDSYIVRVHAEVSKGKIQDDSLAVRNLIELKGRPRFVVEVQSFRGLDEFSAGAVQSAFRKELIDSYFSVVDQETHQEALERRIQRAKIEGDENLAERLKLQMSTGYTVKADVSGERWEKQVWGAGSTGYRVELTVRAVHRDVAGVLGQAMGEGVVRDVGNLRQAGFMDACRKAVREAFPQLKAGILEHWLRDLDNGRTMVVQVYEGSYRVVGQLMDEMRKMEGILKVQPVELHGGGISTIRLIGRVTPEDIAGHVHRWTGGELRVRTVQENRLAVELNSQEPSQEDGAGASPARQHSQGKDEGPTGNRAAGKKLGQGSQKRPVGNSPETDEASSPGGEGRYALGAAVGGTCLFAGIAAAAFALKKAR